jgi:hypothetical protein
MNLQKLAELLRAVCGKGWASGGGTDSGIYIYTQDYTLRWEPGDSDESNATWIIWCLDRLEELGWGECFLAWRNDKNLYEVFKSWDDIGGGFTVSEGKTRAEAVTFALAKALGVEDE